MLPLLVDSASAGVRDLHRARGVILSLDPTWLAEHLPGEVERVLASPTVTDWEYRRLAELLQLARSPYLAAVVAKAAASADPEIRKVGEDYADPSGDSWARGVRANTPQAPHWWRTPPAPPTR